MNKVYISGTVADVPMFIRSEGGSAHLVFQMCVHHRTARGAVKRELYRVNAWNSTALWGKENLRQGQQLALQGYLTQRVARDTGILSVEVAVEEFFPGTMFLRNSQIVSGSEAKSETTNPPDTVTRSQTAADSQPEKEDASALEEAS